MDLLSCQEKLKEKLSPSFPPLRHSPLLLHQESARSALCHLPGAILGAGALEEPASGPERRHDPVPGLGASLHHRLHPQAPPAWV